MRHFHLKIILLLLFITWLSTAWAQQKNKLPTNRTPRDPDKLIITGARFTYPFVQKLIDQYIETNPSKKITIDPRGTSDPLSYDILVEAYDQDEAIKKTRDFIYIGRYPILIVANATSAFTNYYSEAGLNRQMITQLFFHNLLSDNDKEQAIKFPYAIYNRLQKAGAPIVFTNYFGFTQKDIRGKAIAGADEHLLKALLRDSVGVSYLPLPLIYDLTSGNPIRGLTILPVDLNGNGKVGSDEKFYSDLQSVLKKLNDQEEIHNIPIAYIHLSLPKTNARPEAIDFLRWVLANGKKELSGFGYLQPLPDKENSDLFVERQPN
jgi:phosphate transport system substrate-binding protein